jgi:hypothetical protein
VLERRIARIALEPDPLSGLFTAFISRRAFTSTFSP